MAQARKRRPVDMRHRSSPMGRAALHEFSKRFASHGVLAFSLILAPALAGLIAAGCGDEQASRAQIVAAPKQVRDQDLARVADVQEAAGDQLLALPGVVGTGVGLDQGQPVILVLVERLDVIGVPGRLGGFRVSTELVGEIHAFSLTDRYRPVPIGVSVGNANQCLPGTAACVLLKPGHRRYLLSANHVLVVENQAASFEPIIQPSLPDIDPACGPVKKAFIVAMLSDFEPVVYDGRTPNRMDAAIAQLTTEDANCATLPPYYGQPSRDPVAPTVGMAVLKVGRTTELTRGSIKAVNVRVKIKFPAGTALFVDQILTTKGFGEFGDSGSLVVTDDGEHHPVGMVIGGGSNGKAIASPIGPILERFDAIICDG